jgi:hypothetical protein
MSSFLQSIFSGPPVRIWRRIAPSTRKLGACATVAFATFKNLAPYAAIELLLPGGSLMALTLWFYRRRKRVPVLARSINTLL